MFLDRKIGFLDIAEIVENALSEVDFDKDDITLEDILQADRETRIKSRR